MNILRYFTHGLYSLSLSTVSLIWVSGQFPSTIYGRMNYPRKIRGEKFSRMVVMERIFTFIMLFSVLINFPLWAEVEAPNYNFSLDAFEVFSPGKSLEEMEKIYGKGEVYSDGELTQLKFYVSYLRYKFPVFVQLKEKKSVGFYARLPQYFSHDLFHQSLINRYQKQDEYFKKEEQAIYLWTKDKALRRIYSGTCTITCFPIFYAVESGNAEDSSESLVKRFSKIKF
jgi:hypothetical protein